MIDVYRILLITILIAIAILPAIFVAQLVNGTATLNNQTVNITIWKQGQIFSSCEYNESGGIMPYSYNYIISFALNRTVIGGSVLGSNLSETCANINTTNATPGFYAYNVVVSDSEIPPTSISSSYAYFVVLAPLNGTNDTNDTNTTTAIPVHNPVQSKPTTTTGQQAEFPSDGRIPSISTTSITSTTTIGQNPGGVSNDNIWLVVAFATIVLLFLLVKGKRRRIRR